MNELTTIQISQETKKKLVDLGSKNESYEQVIVRLLKNQKQQTA